MNEITIKERVENTQDYNNFLPLLPLAVIAVPAAAGYGVYRLGHHKGYKKAEKEKCQTTSTKNPPLAVSMLMGAALTIAGVYAYNKYKNG